MSNHLAAETSPYLLQHAHNPVDWYSWGKEALKQALAKDKPILLSIGYSACHWCHVMAHECFENNDIARLMNENFVNIKVDREERPDLDATYMKAVQAITGRGGWPLTVFLTPEGKPFFGGTYFPPQDGHGIPGFPRILMAVADAYQNRRSEIETAAQRIVTALTSETKINASKEPLLSDTIEQAYQALREDFDKDYGGFGTSPKFPQPMTLEFLLRYFHRRQDSGAMEIVNLTLEKMAKGSIYDQLGGGFHRYSTDRYWLVPHFEKMLYDNALLSRIYLYAYLVTGKQLFRTIAEETLDYVLREMTDPRGGFYSSQDADSDGVEGKYFVWTDQEINEILGENTGYIVNDYFGITAQGNLNGHNVLHVTADLDAEASSVIKQAKSSLLERREQRVKPGRDEKILASWNGLMLASLAEAACALEREDYLAAAVANGSFLLNSMISDGYLKHTYKDYQVDSGYLQDYALVIDGLLALHQMTFSGEWLRQAIRLGKVMVEQFWDEVMHTFYDTSSRHEDLFVRPRSINDGALPSGPSAATLVLLKLARLTDNEQFQQIAMRSLESMQELMRQHPIGFSNWLCGLDLYFSTPKEIAIMGPRVHPVSSELLHILCSTWLPNKVVGAYDPDDQTPVSELRLFENKVVINNQPTIYVCEHYTCQAPVTDPASFLTQLQES